MELFQAHKQWAERPDDERFPTLNALYEATKSYAQTAREISKPWADRRVEAIDSDVQLVGKKGTPALLTHWAFGQICGRVKAPATYLRELPPTLAAQNLNYGLANRVADNGANDAAQMLFHQNGGLLLRAVTSDIYHRVWNWEIAQRLLDLETQGWTPAHKGPLAGWSQGTDVSAPLYASDHDMYAFVCNPQVTIREEGQDEPLVRGVIVSNSEVGAAALKLTRFLYRCMCGNHIIWGASKVVEFSIRHVGEVNGKLRQWAAEIRKYSEESASDEESKIASAKHKLIAATKEQVLDRLFNIRSISIPRKTLDAAYDAVVPDQDGDPNTPWGFTQGLTRHSQTVPFADKRTEIDRAAGKILEFDF